MSMAAHENPLTLRFSKGARSSFESLRTSGMRCHTAAPDQDK